MCGRMAGHCWNPCDWSRDPLRHRNGHRLQSQEGGEAEMNDRIRTWFIQRSKLEWNPQPITAPTVDPELKDLTGPQRVIESLRYFILSAEHWISSDGILREWLRIM